jgi:hypothetical protein
MVFKIIFVSAVGDSAEKFEALSPISRFFTAVADSA